eukprot:3840005-Rhodomonas_salina.2
MWRERRGSCRGARKKAQVKCELYRGACCCCCQSRYRACRLGGPCSEVPQVRLAVRHVYEAS